MPTATSLRPLSTRQQSFIASLAADRAVPAGLGTAVRLAAEGTLDSRGASALITRLLDAPRVNASSAPRPAGTPGRGDVAMPTPSDSTRAGRMLLAGGVEATVTLENGEHVTLRINSRRRTNRGGWANAAPTDEGARINLTANGRRVGWVKIENGVWKVVIRTSRSLVTTAVTALFEYAAGEPVSPLRVQEASRCGRCLRTLTDPVSIARGIGPECFGRGTGSRAARVEAGVEGPNGPTMAQADAEIARREAAHDAAFAAREREQEEAAFASDPDFQAYLRREDVATALAGSPAEARRTREALETAADALTTPAPDQSLSSLAAVAASPVLSRDQQRARDLISEALDAYCGPADRDFAMRTFDQLAAR